MAGIHRLEGATRMGGLAKPVLDIQATAGLYTDIHEATVNSLSDPRYLTNIERSGLGVLTLAGLVMNGTFRNMAKAIVTDPGRKVISSNIQVPNSPYETLTPRAGTLTRNGPVSEEDASFYKIDFFGKIESVTAHGEAMSLRSYVEGCVSGRLEFDTYVLQSSFHQIDETFRNRYPKNIYGIDDANDMDFSALYGVVEGIIAFKLNYQTNQGNNPNRRTYTPPVVPLVPDPWIPSSEPFTIPDKYNVLQKPTSPHDSRHVSRRTILYLLGVTTGIGLGLGNANNLTDLLPPAVIPVVDLGPYPEIGKPKPLTVAEIKALRNETKHGINSILRLAYGLLYVQGYSLKSFNPNDLTTLPTIEQMFTDPNGLEMYARVLEYDQGKLLISANNHLSSNANGDRSGILSLEKSGDIIVQSDPKQSPGIATSTNSPIPEITSLKFGHKLLQSLNRTKAISAGAIPLPGEIAAIADEFHTVMFGSENWIEWQDVTDIITVINTVREEQQMPELTKEYLKQVDLYDWKRNVIRGLGAIPK